jgi:hypothetical protein
VGSIQSLRCGILLFVRITATGTPDLVLNSRTAAAVLWSPVDKNALPSPVDMKHAKETIATLEDALKDAFDLVKSTKLHIAKMEKDLMERKGWIAPIRKVPPEVLVDILLRTSEMDDLAPVKLTAVSRLWRSIILATPKAWSFIHLLPNYERHVYFRNHKGDHDYFPGYKTTYFKRSRPRLLHLNLEKTEGFWPKHTNWIIREHAGRIMCLTTSTDILKDSQSSSQCQQFLYLQTLTVGTPDRGNGASLDSSFFSISRLPALQTLRLPPRCQLTGTNHTISPSTFLPLQHLTVDIGRVSACMDILQSCAGTLKTLSISCFDEPYTTSSPLGMTFPLLRCLTMGRGPSTGPPIVKAITPVLSSLVLDSMQYPMPVFFDADMQNVTHMRWEEFKAPPICSRVRVVQTMIDPERVRFQSRGYADYADKLKEVVAAYPSLETIEISTASRRYDRFHSTQQKVEECLGEDFVKSKLLWTREWQEDLPGYVATTVRFVSNLSVRPTNH